MLFVFITGCKINMYSFIHSDRRLTQPALEEPNITLKKLLDMGNTVESAFQQAKSIENHVKPRQNQAAAFNKIN